MVTRPFVTYVQLRLLPLRSLSGPGSNDSNGTLERTPNIDAYHPSDYCFGTRCRAPWLGENIDHYPSIMYWLVARRPRSSALKVLIPL